MTTKSIGQKALILSIFGFLGFLSPTLVEAADIPRDSLFQEESQWKTQEGKSVSLKSFMGETLVVAMTYTGCQYACPMTVAKLESIEKEFKQKGLKNYRFLVASFDPEKDTPEALKAYMKKKKISFEKWTFLSAPSDVEVRKLAVLLNVSYQKLDGGDFSHSNNITLLGPDGRVGATLKGTSSAHDELVEKAASYETAP